MGIPNKEFKRLLTQAIYAIKLNKDTSINIIEDELGYAIGRNGRITIEHWRRGHVPKPSDVEKLAWEILGRAKLDRDWLVAFLRSAGYPDYRGLCDELLPVSKPPITQHAESGLALVNPNHTSLTTIKTAGNEKYRKRKVYAALTSVLVVLIGLIWGIAYYKGLFVSVVSPRAIPSAIFPGSTQCGSLGWGVWQKTENLYKAHRIIYFEPNRVGTHQMEFYLNTLGGYMKPYWSIDGGTTWSVWEWAKPDGLIPNKNNGIQLRTDTTTTIHKFDFYLDSDGYIDYRFYCQ